MSTPVVAPTCSICQFVRQNPKGLWECHFNPPVAITVSGPKPNGNDTVFAYWPLVGAGDWCGSFK